MVMQAMHVAVVVHRVEALRRTVPYPPSPGPACTTDPTAPGHGGCVLLGLVPPVAEPLPDALYLVSGLPLKVSKDGAGRPGLYPEHCVVS